MLIIFLVVPEFVEQAMNGTIMTIVVISHRYIFPIKLAIEISI